jgi:hypothetical protein
MKNFVQLEKEFRNTSEEIGLDIVELSPEQYFIPITAEANAIRTEPLSSMIDTFLESMCRILVLYTPINYIYFHFMDYLMERGYTKEDFVIISTSSSYNVTEIYNLDPGRFDARMDFL